MFPYHDSCECVDDRHDRFTFEDTMIGNRHDCHHHHHEECENPHHWYDHHHDPNVCPPAVVPMFVGHSDVYHKHEEHPHHKHPLSGIHTAEPFLEKKEHLDGCCSYVFHPSHICMLENLFSGKPYGAMSIEQKQFFRRFLFEAGIVTDALNGYPVDVKCNTSDLVLSLDKQLSDVDKFIPVRRPAPELHHHRHYHCHPHPFNHFRSPKPRTPNRYPHPEPIRVPVVLPEKPCFPHQSPIIINCGGNNGGNNSGMDSSALEDLQRKVDRLGNAQERLNNTVNDIMADVVVVKD